MTSFSIFKLHRKIKKNLSKVLNTFENIMENKAFALWSKCSIFHNNFKNVVFQRRQKALLWSKGLANDTFFQKKANVCFVLVCLPLFDLYRL